MKTLLIILPIVFSCAAFSQDYFPLIADGKIWKVELYGWGMQHLTYSLGEPVVLNGQTYTRVISVNEDNPEPYEVCYIREDAEEMKVYIFDSGTGMNEYLLYDFGVIPGQTVSIYSLGFVRDITISSVGTILINGEPRVDIQFTDMGTEGRWIGGMGSIYGVPDATLGSVVDYYPVVTCYYEDNLLTWDYSGDKSTCDTELGIRDDIENTDVQISPNPASDNVVISFSPRFSGQKFSATILDRAGNQIFSSFIIADYRTNIRLPDIANGLYLLKISRGNEFSLSTRLCIDQK